MSEAPVVVVGGGHNELVAACYLAKAGKRVLVLEGCERIEASAVVTAVDVQTALLDLLDPPLAGRDGVELTAAHRGNAVQMLVHLATDELPPYPDARPCDWNGLRSRVDTLDELRRRCAPYDVEGGWQDQQEAFADATIAQVETHAPGFADSITNRHIRTPTFTAKELRWPGAHPMQLDISLDQLAFMRPTRRLSGHTVPGVSGLFTCGASTAPVGGIAGSSGKAAALELLKAAP